VRLPLEEVGHGFHPLLNAVADGQQQEPLDPVLVVEPVVEADPVQRHGLAVTDDYGRGVLAFGHGAGG
jgi:hypothetical protein